jgi:hypothetical protein
VLLRICSRRSEGVVTYGTLWSTVARVQSGRRTGRPAVLLWLNSDSDRQRDVSVWENIQSLEGLRTGNFVYEMTAETPDQLLIHQVKRTVGIAPIDVDQGQAILLGRSGEDEKNLAQHTGTGGGVG